MNSATTDDVAMKVCVEQTWLEEYVTARRRRFVHEFRQGRAWTLWTRDWLT